MSASQLDAGKILLALQGAAICRACSDCARIQLSHAPKPSPVFAETSSARGAGIHAGDIRQRLLHREIRVRQKIGLVEEDKLRSLEHVRIFERLVLAFR